jgi:hypothetical protein
MADNKEIQATSFDEVMSSDFICTVDTDTVEGKKVAANALNAAVSLKEIGDKKFKLVNVITTPGTRSQTGEDCINTYLIDAKGTAYFTQSTGILRSAKNLAAVFNGDFGEGIDVQVVSNPTNTGNTIKSLKWL